MGLGVKISDISIFKFFFFFYGIIRIEQQVLFRVYFLYGFRGFSAPRWGHLRIIIFVAFSVTDSFVFQQQVLFRVDFLSVTLDHRVQCPRVGLGVKI